MRWAFRLHQNNLATLDSSSRRKLLRLDFQFRLFDILQFSIIFFSLRLNWFFSSFFVIFPLEILITPQTPQHKKKYFKFLWHVLAPGDEWTQKMWNTAECEVTEFTAWSSCSVTCGKGLRERTRRYRQPQQAAAKRCARQLVFKEMCVARIPECAVNSHDSSNSAEDEDLTRSQATVNEQGDGIGICRTTPWSDWSECSGILRKKIFIFFHLS